jgi:hypothetical protein
VEAKMVKKFRRAAAGIEEQLPSDLRKPHVLSQTCDYLFNEVVANAPELGRVHHFVWDRTRAIRNDFTILQVSAPEDLSHAVDCLERIARFHILSLHQMAGVKEKDFQYDWQQDREQLDRTLVSLMQYYDDSRGKIPLPNESEFRAYLIVFQLQDPDMEDRVQSWPQDLVRHPRIRKAMKLYAAAGSTSSFQGPLRPAAKLPIAQQDWQRFWCLVESDATSYLTACVAEINFNLIRRVALQSLYKSVNQRATADFSVDEFCDMLAFNDGFEAEDYLACYSITFQDRDEGRFADISALKNQKQLPEPSPAPPKQLKSEMVEYKRFGRTLPAVISGFTVKEAQDNGMINEEELTAGDAEMGDEGAQDHEEEEAINDGESLFMPETAKTKSQASPFSVDFDKPTTSVFGQPTEQPKTSAFSFGKPSAGVSGPASTGFGAPTATASNGFGAPTAPASTGFGAPTAPTTAPATSFGADKPNSFNFLSGGTSTSAATTPKPASSFSGFSGFGQPTSTNTAPSKSTFGGPSFGETSQKDTASPASAGFGFAQKASGDVDQTKPDTTSSLFSQVKPDSTSSLFSQIKPSSTSSMFGSPQQDATSSQSAPPKQEAASSFFSPPQTNGKSSLFSPPQMNNTSTSFGQSSQQATGPPNPFIEEGSDSPPSSSPTRGGFPSAFTPSAPSAEKPTPPSFSFTAPTPKESEFPKAAAASFASFGAPTPKESEPPKAPAASFASFGKPEETAQKTNAAPSFSAGPSTTTSSAAPTTSFAPPPQPDPKGNHVAEKSKRASPRVSFGAGSDQFNRPTHPSPLAQSYTAASDAPSTPNPASQAPPQTFPPSFTSATQSKPAKITPAAPELSFDAIISDVARKVTLSSDTGLLDQFLEYHIGKVITDIQEELHFERLNAQADAHRTAVLSHRFLILWRDICRRRRLARRGQDKRRRAQERLKESKNQAASDIASIAGSASVLGRTHRGSVMGSEMSRQEEVDKMFQQSFSSGRWSRLAKRDEQAKGGSKRPTSSHSMDSLASSHDAGHKRLKSTSHVDDSGRVIKVAPMGPPSRSNGALKRSSFRDALPDNPPVASTTKSNYFRLKALGHGHVYDLAPTYSRKRHHSEVTHSPAPSSRVEPEEASPVRRESPPSSKLRRTSRSSVTSRHTAEETDAVIARADDVIARARAARELLRDGGTSFFPLEQDTNDPLRQSTGSQVLYGSPSMERARIDARLRASHYGTDFGSSRRSDVPAYRLRESKFVPREQYGKAIERSREFRLSRSGNTSRPESRIDTFTPSKPVETVESRPAPPSFIDETPTADSARSTTATFGNIPQLVQPQWPTAQPSAFSTSTTPFGGFTQNLGASRPSTLGDVNNTTRPSGFGSHSFQPTQTSGFASHAFQPSQNTLDMQDIFGQPDGTNTTTSYQSGFARHAPLEQSTNGNNAHDSDDDLQITGATTPHVNGFSTGVTSNGHRSEYPSNGEEDIGHQQTSAYSNSFAALSNGLVNDDSEEGEDDQQQTIGHPNPYAALVNGDDMMDNDQFGQYNSDADQPGVYPGGDPGSGDFEDEDGDVEDEDGEGFDEEGSDLEDELEDEEEYEDEDDEDDGAEAHKPSTNARFAEPEVIELSD